MRIGIDVSQTAYEGTGVSNFVMRLVRNLLTVDKDNEYVLFFSGMRRSLPTTLLEGIDHERIQVKTFRIPPSVLDVLWNRLHILPIERFIGEIDIFISSDWTQPPLQHAKGISVLYDLIVYKHPDETAASIVTTQKRRLRWMKKECNTIICISEATKRDAKEILGISDDRLVVIYPGMTL